MKKAGVGVNSRMDKPASRSQNQSANPSFYQKLKQEKSYKENKSPALMSHSPISNINSIHNKGHHLNYPHQYNGIIPSKSPQPSQRYQNEVPASNRGGHYPLTTPKPSHEAAQAENYTNDMFFKMGGKSTGAKMRQNRQPYEEHGAAHGHREVKRKLFDPNNPKEYPTEAAYEAEQAYLLRRANINKEKRRKKAIYEMSPPKDEPKTNFNHERMPYKDHTPPTPRKSPYRGRNDRYSQSHPQDPQTMRPLPQVDRYGRPIAGQEPLDEPPKKEEYWAGRKPMRPPSPPKFAKEAELEVQEHYTPERRGPTYIEISPGVRSSPWRDDLQKQKELKRKEERRRKEVERLKQKQMEIFFNKRRHYDDYYESESKQNIQAPPLKMKTLNGRYPNPEDMYNKYREIQKRNSVRKHPHTRKNSLWARDMEPYKRKPRERRHTAQNPGRSPGRYHEPYY